MTIVVDTEMFGKAVEEKLNKFTRKTGLVAITINQDNGSAYLYIAGLFLEHVVKGHLEWFRGSLDWNKKLFLDKQGMKPYSSIYGFLEFVTDGQIVEDYEQPSDIIYSEAAVKAKYKAMMASKQALGDSLTKKYDLDPRDSDTYRKYRHDLAREALHTSEYNEARKLMSRVCYDDGKKRHYFPSEFDRDNWLFDEIVIRPLMELAESLLAPVLESDKWSYWTVSFVSRTRTDYNLKGDYLRIRALELIEQGSTEFFDDHEEVNNELVKDEPLEIYTSLGEGKVGEFGGACTWNTPMVRPRPKAGSCRYAPAPEIKEDGKEELIVVPKSVYVRGDVVPSLSGLDIARGLYRDVSTDKIIESIDDITGPVNTIRGEPALTLAEYWHGIADGRHGGPDEVLRRF